MTPFRDRLSLRTRFYLRYARNLFSPSGRQQNRRYRQSWAWYMAHFSALAAGKDLQTTIYDNFSFVAHPNDESVGRIVFLSHDWAPDEGRVMAQVVTAGMTVLDIGANIGAHTLRLARAVGERGQVHAFEPSAAAAYLQRNVTMNGLVQVTVNAAALGETPGTLRLARTIPGAEAFSSIGKPYAEGVSSGYMDVPCLTLDDYTVQKGITQISFAKMDVEGAEVGVLRGASRLLKTRAVAVWLFEINQPCLTNAGVSAGDLLALFQGAGYRLYHLHEDGTLSPFDPSTVPKSCNAVAALPEAAPSLSVLIR
ncbi:MAG TPA: FkbM family methyltransferase [Aggregatilineales bacterium]|nr:FkbM family methyltransferase [Anaerolineales bacterium]HRE49299.1 FkbM family methyltransferase [Aggregatilineales bacterium]